MNALCANRLNGQVRTGVVSFSGNELHQPNQKVWIIDTQHLKPQWRGLAIQPFGGLRTETSHESQLGSTKTHPQKWWSSYTTTKWAGWPNERCTGVHKIMLKAKAKCCCIEKDKRTLSSSDIFYASLTDYSCWGTGQHDARTSVMSYLNLEL